MTVSEPQAEHSMGSASTRDFSSVPPKPGKTLPLWLVILMAAFTAIVLIWVMLIIIYPSIALS